MPNWVRNSVIVSAKSETKSIFIEGPTNKNLREFFDKITAKHPLANNEDGEFSFHNVIEPDPEIWSDYDTGPVSLSTKADNPNNWYDWNIEHWGTKWDVIDCSSSFWKSDKTENIELSFNTAWSPPEPIINEFIDICRKKKLNLSWYFEEEQGWGGRVIVKDGEVFISEWDIPESHEDYEEIGKECVCMWNPEAEYWFDDCPNKEEEMKRQQEGTNV
jgi:Ferredoxin-like domain in Api92-like protein